MQMRHVVDVDVVAVAAAVATCTMQMRPTVGGMVGVGAAEKMQMRSGFDWTWIMQMRRRCLLLGRC